MTVALHMPMGRVDHRQIEAGTRFFRTTEAVLETASELPVYNEHGELMDAYNPSGQVEGAVALRYEKRHGMFVAVSHMCKVGPDGQLTLMRRPDGTPVVLKGEDPGLFELPDGSTVWRVTKPTWPENMTEANFNINAAERLDTEFHKVSLLGRTSLLGVVDGKGPIPVAKQDGRVGGYYRYQNRAHGSVRDVEMWYAEADSFQELLDAQRLGKGQPVGDGAFALDTGGGFNGAYDMGDGNHLLLAHYAYDIGTSPRDNLPTPCIYNPAMAIHNTRTGKLGWLGLAAPYYEWRTYPEGGPLEGVVLDPYEAKFPPMPEIGYLGRPEIAYPSSMHDVRINEKGNLVVRARAGLQDSKFGRFALESIMPYNQIAAEFARRS